MSTSLNSMKDLIAVMDPDTIKKEINNSINALNSARNQSEQSVNITATLLNSLNKLNNKFLSMNTSVYKGINAWTQVQSRLHPYVCGLTSSKSGNLNGYFGANSLCRSYCGTSSAHICRVPEFLEQLEGSTYFFPSSGECWWPASGNHKTYASQGVNDCVGFSSSSGYGSLWCGQSGPQGFPGIGNCVSYFPVACCDYVNISQLL